MRRVHLKCHSVQPLTCGLVLQGTRFYPGDTLWGPSAVLPGTGLLTLTTLSGLPRELFADPWLGVAAFPACILASPCMSLPTRLDPRTTCSTISKRG